MKKSVLIVLLALVLAFASTASALCPFCNPYLSNGYTMDDMMDEARRLGEAAIGGTAHIVFAGNVREQASANSPIVGKVYIDESYEIVGMEMPANGSIWFGITYGDGVAWVAGGLVTVLPGSYTEGGEMSELIGREVVVKVGSGSTRVAPGMAADKNDIIVAGEKYVILDCGMDQTGYVWYQIGENAWVSSGIVDLQ